MTTLGRWVRYGLFCILLAIAPVSALAAPYAALVMDARTGEVLYSTNADTRLHPASLTKMMTLYIAFEAIERGEISLDTKVTVSAHAANEPPSRLGLRAGQKIALRYLIRGAAIKSANDAATAIGEAISGSEAEFAKRMNRTARALGMRNSTFQNANGLTRKGHLSTARDMTIMGRRLFYDFPQYYSLFSRRTADAGIAQVANTNRRFLDAYEGADGIKTGFTNPAGFNLTASAQRGNKRIIATVFGGTSTAQRNAKVAELLDLGFGKAPGRVKETKPAAPQYLAEADTAPEDREGGAGKTIRLVAAVVKSPRPPVRPAPAAVEPDPAADALAAAVAEAVAESMAAAMTPTAETPAPAEPVALAQAITPPAEKPITEVPAPEAKPESLLLAEAPRPVASPGRDAVSLEARAEPAAPQAPAEPPVEIAAEMAPEPAEPVTGFAQVSTPQPETVQLAAAPTPGFGQATPAQPETLAMALAPAPTPEAKPAAKPWQSGIILAALTPEAAPARAEPEVIARVSSSGGRHWGISLGKYASSYQAERLLLQTALMESDTLGDALRKVANRKGGFEANFVGLSKEGAELACRRLAARATDCTVIGP